MFVNRGVVQIQWGDCDPANIAYHPRYFEMFDDSTSIMFEAAAKPVPLPEEVIAKFRWG
jgi:4-hydroxybenzoyl-CoA thioesterase